MMLLLSFEAAALQAIPNGLAYWVGVILTVLLALALAAREVLRAYDGRRTNRLAGLLDYLVIALLPVVGLVIATRIADLLE